MAVDIFELELVVEEEEEDDVEDPTRMDGSNDISGPVLRITSFAMAVDNAIEFVAGIGTATVSCISNRGASVLDKAV